MRFGQALKMAIRSITARKMRTALTMLGIIIGIASVIILVSIVQGSNQRMMEYYERLGNNRISVEIYQDDPRAGQLLYDYCARAKDTVLGVTPQEYINGSITTKLKSTDNMEYGTPDIYLGNDQFSICNNFVIALGRDISFLDVENYHNVVVLGARVAKYLFDFTNPIGEQVAISGQPFTVVGVYQAKDPDSDYSMDNIAVVPESANRILNENQTITSFTVKAVSSSATKKAMSGIAAYLRNLIGEENFWLYSENQYIEDDNKQNAMLSMVLGGIAGISLLVGGIGIMNIMLVTVSERTKEIGIRKAIGAPRSDILLQFLVEASVVCGAGGLLGILLGIFGTLIAGKLILDLVLVPDMRLMAGAFLFSAILGMMFGMYPAVKASALTPVAALRGNE